MARLLFPDAGSRLAEGADGRHAASRTYTVYTNAAGTVLADILADSNGTPGAAYAGSRVTTDTYGYLPLFWGPNDSTDRLYVTDGVAPVWPIDADYNARIDNVVATPTTHATTHASGGSDPVTLAQSQITGLTAALTAKVNQASTIRYVADYIPSGTDTTSVNCSPYIQQAVTDAGVGGIVVINGRLRCDTEITLSNYQQVTGTGIWMGTGSPITSNCLDFRNVSANASLSNQKVGIRVAQGNVFRNLLISGPGPTTASSRGVSTVDGVASSPRFYNCEFYSWEHGVHLYGGYYSRFYDCSFQYNSVGLYADACYNLDLYGCKFTCRDSTTTNFYTGIQVNALARGLKMFGGSIEDYTTAVRCADHSDILLSGVYFETPNHAPAVGIEATGANGLALTLFSCSVYLLNLAQWLNMPTGTKCSVAARGNKFIYNQYTPDNSVVAPTVPIAYNIGLSAGDMDLSGDSWEAVFYNASVQSSGYTNNAWTARATQPTNYDVRFPSNDPNSNRHLNNYVGRNIVQPASKQVTTGGLNVVEQANGRQGVATLVGGTVTVANTAITASSRIMLSTQALGTVAAPVAMAVTARSVGVSFTITSADATDTSTVAYQIYEPG